MCVMVGIDLYTSIMMCVCMCVLVGIDLCTYITVFWLGLTCVCMSLSVCVWPIYICHCVLVRIDQCSYISCVYCRCFPLLLAFKYLPSFKFVLFAKHTTSSSYWSVALITSHYYYYYYLITSRLTGRAGVGGSERVWRQTFWILLKAVVEIKKMSLLHLLYSLHWGWQVAWLTSID